jgi:hypothetical protein
LHSGTVIGLSAAGIASLPAAAYATPPSRRPMPSGNLVLNYQPSQPTGWQPTTMLAGPGARSVGMTVGGHTSSLDFPLNGKNYRISLLSFGQPGDSPDPVYEAAPSDSTVDYEKTLADKFGAFYSFNYKGGFAGRSQFSVESYSVFVNEPTTTSPILDYGINLYFAYHPDVRHGDPDIQASLQFIQVVNWAGSGQTGSMVDNADRANPFYIWGGLTSVYGNQFVSFNDSPQVAGLGGVTGDLAGAFVAETFLVRDTGIKDRSRKAIIEVFGGIKYGWQVQSV